VVTHFNVISMMQSEQNKLSTLIFVPGFMTIALIFIYLLSVSHSVTVWHWLFCSLCIPSLFLHHG
jgi:hypothetical protein